jgi:hypothetical protein
MWLGNNNYPYNVGNSVYHYTLDIISYTGNMNTICSSGYCNLHVNVHLVFHTWHVFHLHLPCSVYSLICAIFIQILELGGKNLWKQNFINWSSNLVLWCFILIGLEKLFYNPVYNKTEITFQHLSFCLTYLTN